jgi:glycosyltransferase involved in cell wall biosynthesis
VGTDDRALQEAPRLKLSIVVPAFNEERLLPATLDSIRSAARAFDQAGGWELIVCDNHSTDGTAGIARAAGARVVFEPHNQISRARNAGAATAAGEWIVFVDADSTPSRALFEDLREAIDSGLVLAGGSTIAADSNALSVRAALGFWNAISRGLHWAAGAFVYCEAAAFRRIGGFSEELYASEELDLSQRLKRLAQEEGKEFRILFRHPLLTSDRKRRLYSTGELAKVFGRFLLHPRRMLRSAKDCSPWYDGRR